jgi:hypothetical protein
MFKVYTIVFIFIFCCGVCFSQNIKMTPRPNVEAQKIATNIKLDGSLKDKAWANATLLNNFTEFSPTPFKPEEKATRTEVYLIYNNEGIYVGGKCFEQTADSITRELVGRDGFGNNDFFGCSFDTYNDKINGFEYLVTPLNEQFDAKIATGGEDFTWNAVWESKTKIESDGWTFEIFIPFAAIRFGKSKIQNWGINFFRYRAKTNQKTAWASIDPVINGALPQQGYWNNLKDIKPPLRLQFSPYLSYYTTIFSQTKPGEKKVIQQVNGGMDVKYGINQAFTLDMALIPDFGQVQTDNRVLNLGPFEQQFTEQRPFFTEGTELFSKGNLFYSRRIGKNPVQANNNYYSTISTNEEIITDPQETKILNATKVSGRMQNGLAIGVLNAITGTQFATIKNNITGEIRKENSYPFTNYNMLVLDQTLKNNSSISLVNTNVTRNGSYYDANVSMFLANINDKTNTWNIGGSAGLSQLIGAADNGKTISGYTQNLYFGKTSGRFQFNIDHVLTDTKFNKNDLGYQSNNNTIDNSYFFSYNWNKPKGWYNNMYMNFNGQVSHLFKAIDPLKQKGHLFQSYFTAFNFSAQTKKLWYIYLNINNSTESNDYYEARKTGSVFKRGGRTGFYTNISSNDTKKYSFSTGLGYRKGRQFKNTYGYFTELSQKIRFNPKVSLEHYANLDKVHNQGGYGATDNATGDVYFTRRITSSIVNRLSFKYSFTNRMGLTLGVRHYWSDVIPLEVYTLASNGKLNTVNPISTTAPSLNKLAINYNDFNVNMLYTWQVANGSFLNIAWQDVAGNFERGSFERNYFKNIDKTFNSSHANTLSIKMVYFLDYLQVKNKLKSKKA